MSLYQKFKEALSKTSGKISQEIDNIFVKKKLDSSTLEQLEDLLLLADVGFDSTEYIISELKKHKFNKEVSPEEIKSDLANIISKILDEQDHSFILKENGLNVILVCGVNGNGKTTTIGKLASIYQKQGKSVAIAACDTFRAAAVEQIENWANRAGAIFYKGLKASDPASLAFKAVSDCIEKNTDILFIDTAGRLHNHTNLMQELERIVKVIKKIDASFPTHTLLTVDGTTGQNALLQVETFKKVARINGVITTKLDGTAKAGALISIAKEQKLPIYFVGIGEGIDDIKPFSSNDFSESLVGLK